MKQISLDKAMNDTLDIIYTSDIETIDKLELLMNLRKFFTDYNKMIHGVEQDKIIRFNDTVEKTR